MTKPKHEPELIASGQRAGARRALTLFDEMISPLLDAPPLTEGQLANVVAAETWRNLPDRAQRQWRTFPAGRKILEHKDCVGLLGEFREIVDAGLIYATPRQFRGDVQRLEKSDEGANLDRWLGEQE